MNTFGWVLLILFVAFIYGLYVVVVDVVYSILNPDESFPDTNEWGEDESFLENNERVEEED